MLSIPHDNILAYDGTLNLDTILFWYISLLYLFENGDVLFKADTPEKKDIMICNRDKKVFKPCFGRETTMRGRSFIYIETFISPNRYMTPASLRTTKLLNRVSMDSLILYVS